MKCSICGNGNVEPVGSIAPYTDFSCDVFDCAKCGSRFTPHIEIHNSLHDSDESTYVIQRDIADKVADHIRSGEAELAGRYLRRIPKFRFLIETVEREYRGGTIVEVGCSTGFLSAYLRARGYSVMGLDVSEAAIDYACATFSGQFTVADVTMVEEIGPVAGVIHAGTIGCVPAPVAFTRTLLRAVTPGGFVAFNAPNVEVCRSRGVWGSSTSPPDLVSLFSPEFWHTWFSDLADVAVEVAYDSPSQRLSAMLGRRPGIDRNEDATVPLSQGGREAGRLGGGSMVRRTGVAVLDSLGVLCERLGWLPMTPAEFGVHVLMRPHDRGQSGQTPDVGGVEH